MYFFIYYLRMNSLMRKLSKFNNYSLVLINQAPSIYTYEERDTKFQPM